MKSKERVAKAVAFKQPDVTPVDYWVLPAAYLKYGTALFDLLKKYPKDFADGEQPGAPYTPPPNYRKGDYTDRFGSLWHQDQDGFLGQISKFPLSDPDSLKTYGFPGPEDGETSLQDIRDLISMPANADKFICADFIRTFERMHFLRGMENLLMDMAYGKDEFFELLDRVVEWNISHLRLVLDELGGRIGGVWFSDDWGSQNSLLISPAMWRKFFKPRYAKMFEVVKKQQKAVFFHSDGFIMDVIEDFIELGVDALNCQINLLGAERLAERFAGRITFHTDLDRQHVQPFGSPADVKNLIRDVTRNLGGRGGGLILCAEIGPDMPFENIRALVEGFNESRMR
jgi:uroporphyrinogen decarboxylase